MRSDVFKQKVNDKKVPDRAVKKIFEEEIEKGANFEELIEIIENGRPKLAANILSQITDW